MKNTLYISDLDGTLLNEHVELSNYTVQTLNNLISQGVHFTVATARTVASVSSILSPVAINIPIILMNGVLIYDMAAKKYLNIHRLSKESIATIIQVLKDNSLTGFAYEVKDHVLATYYERLESKALKDFHDERVNKYQKIFTHVSDFADINPEHLIYFALMDSKERLEPAYQALMSIPDIDMAFYKDIYAEDFWYLEIFSNKATKYNAAQYLRSQYNYDYVVGFGDNLNDIPLFRACDECCAVANAREDVKAIASHVIASNRENGVAKWLNTRITETLE